MSYVCIFQVDYEYSENNLVSAEIVYEDEKNTAIEQQSNIIIEERDPIVERTSIGTEGKNTSLEEDLLEFDPNHEIPIDVVKSEIVSKFLENVLLNCKFHYC